MTTVKAVLVRALIILLLLPASSCWSTPVSGSVVGVLNYSESSRQAIPPDYYSRAINSLLMAYPDEDISFWVIARYPLCLSLHNVPLSFTYEEVQKELEAEYHKQSGGVDPQGKPWGKGTDHATVFRRIAENRVKETPLLVVGVTDGENELHPWGEVKEALKELFAGGPTRLVLVGISQRVVDERKSLTVLNRWEQALKQGGATNLATNPRAERGYLLRATPAELPEWALWMPKSKQGGTNR